MRKVFVLGGSESHGLVNRLAAEVAARNMQDVQVVSADSVEELAETIVEDASSFASDDTTQVVIVEGTQTQIAVDEVLTSPRSQEKVAQEIPSDVIVLGGGLSVVYYEKNLAALEMYVPTVAVEPPRQEAHYWTRGNHAFDRKQQAMRAKARRR